MSNSLRYACMIIAQLLLWAPCLLGKDIFVYAIGTQVQPIPTDSCDHCIIYYFNIYNRVYSVIQLVVWYVDTWSLDTTQMYNAYLIINFIQCSKMMTHYHKNWKVACNSKWSEDKNWWGIGPIFSMVWALGSTFLPNRWNPFPILLAELFNGVK